MCREHHQSPGIARRCHCEMVEELVVEGRVCWVPRDFIGDGDAMEWGRILKGGNSRPFDVRRPWSLGRDIVGAVDVALESGEHGVLVLSKRAGDVAGNVEGFNSCDVSCLRFHTTVFAVPHKATTSAAACARHGPYLPSVTNRTILCEIFSVHILCLPHSALASQVTSGRSRVTCAQFLTTGHRTLCPHLCSAIKLRCLQKDQLLGPCFRIVEG